LLFSSLPLPHPTSITEIKEKYIIILLSWNRKSYDVTINKLNLSFFYTSLLDKSNSPPPPPPFMPLPMSSPIIHMFLSSPLSLSVIT